MHRILFLIITYMDFSGFVIVKILILIVLNILILIEKIDGLN